MTEAFGPWVPEACTLPTVERPFRQAEFDSLFAGALRTQERLSPTVLQWTLDPTAEATARDLAERETVCCSFFAFDFTVGGDTLQVKVQVPAAQVRILDALAARASVGLAAA
jgi:hypothetical protein